MSGQRSPALIARADHYGPRTAVVDTAGSHTYAALAADAQRVAGALRESAEDLEEARVAFLVAPGSDYVRTQWGIWSAGGVAVPLCPSHPPAELDYVIGDSGARSLVADAGSVDILRPLAHARGLRTVTVAEALDADPAPHTADIPDQRRATILYTSGTTGRPKGVVTTHGALRAQVETLVDAWEWRPEDRILHTLPLHHVHGIVNALACALWSGATCEMLPRFDAEAVWQRLASGDVTLFMAVPTIYVKLIAAWEAAPSRERSAWAAGAQNLRLMVSGSAALPVPVLEKWREITGHVLLERYGMTEIGMALSNPLHGERIAGSVGTPLPGVDVRLVDESDAVVGRSEPGEIQVRGPGVFDEYWQRPEETAASFVNGWFRTGDVAVVDDGRYRILGRRSVDILKSGGYKISALEIESALLNHPAIAECAVVGVPDDEWGERVAAAVVLAPGQALDLDHLRTWARDVLAPYKIPTRLLTVDTLPRNPLGKVQKPAVAAQFEA